MLPSTSKKRLKDADSSLRTGYDLRTATRSLNLMLAEWANRGLNQWTIKQNAIPMLTGTITYNLDPTDSTAAIDVLDVFVREEIQGTNTDVPSEPDESS